MIVEALKAKLREHGVASVAVEAVGTLASVAVYTVAVTAAIALTAVVAMPLVAALELLDRMTADEGGCRCVNSFDECFCCRDGAP
jgi:hypothetical protein